jgi:hypothetical protein
MKKKLTKRQREKRELEARERLQRAGMAWMLHGAGATYKEIAAQLHVSIPRARDIAIWYGHVLAHRTHPQRLAIDPVIRRLHEAGALSDRMIWEWDDKDERDLRMTAAQKQARRKLAVAKWWEDFLGTWGRITNEVGKAWWASWLATWRTIGIEHASRSSWTFRPAAEIDRKNPAFFVVGRGGNVYFRLVTGPFFVNADALIGTDPGGVDRVVI